MIVRAARDETTPVWQLAHSRCVPPALRILGPLAVAALGLVAAAVGCGAGGNDAHRFGTFTDCAKIGPLTTVTDAAHDQRGGLGGAAPQPQGDLLALRLTRRDRRLCAEFRTRADIVPSAAYVLALRPQATDTPVVQLEGTVLAASAPEALLNTGEHGASFRRIAATVGIDGKRLSILVDRGEFARYGVADRFDAFRFQARTVVVVGDTGRQTDCAPSCR